MLFFFLIITVVTVVVGFHLNLPLIVALPFTFMTLDKTLYFPRCHL